MSIYEKYAEIYDTTNQIAFSLKMIAYLNQVLDRYRIATDSALDLACGTGTVAISFASRGWETYAVDISPRMLAIARQKAETEGVLVAFSQQDMRSFILPRPVGLITCLYDSLNYLLSLRDFEQTLAQVARALCPGGYFLFDMNTPWFLQHSWDNRVLCLDYETAYLIMQGQYDADQAQATVTITGFVRKGDLYEKFVEQHTERGYTLEQVSRMVEKSGLQVIATHDCFTFNPPLSACQRIFWITRKPFPSDGIG